MRNKNKKVYFVLILIVLFGISIGYAAISRTLSITGNSEVKQNTWNIYFDNVLVKNGSVTADIPVIDTTTKSTVSFNVMLNLPGDFYEFTVDVKNEGTIDAMIESVEDILALTDEQKKYINYSITYQGGDEIKAKQILSHEDYVRLKVRLEYRTDITENELPSTTQNLNLGFTLNYVQADSTGSIVKNHGVIGANGDINEIGTIVTIGTEQFYTIGTEGDNVKLLSMYNLYVGGSHDGNTWTAYGAEATGMQDSTMLGFVSGQSIRKGTTKFSNTNSTYEGSIVEGYVNNYKTILEEDYGVEVVEARLITKDELTDSETFACVEMGFCSKKYPWIYSTPYWSGSAYDDDSVWFVDSYGGFFHRYYINVSDYGVRPVVIISKSLF